MDNKIYDESRTRVTEPVAKNGVASDSRRRFTKTGLGAGAVIATLASQPVLGAAPYNCTISGHASGNVSTHGPEGNCAIGLSHGYWKTHTATGDWPAPFAPSQLFRNAGAPNSLLDAPGITTGQTMLQVLNLGGGDMTALAREVVCALLNAQQFAPNFPLSMAQIKQIWNEVVNTGQYQVNASVSWTDEDVKNYLESLHDS
ncbi:MAG: hypothetical protein ACYCZJ_07170 [Sulfuriferula sp.]